MRQIVGIGEIKFCHVHPKEKTFVSGLLEVSSLRLAATILSEIIPHFFVGIIVTSEAWVRDRNVDGIVDGIHKMASDSADFTLAGDQKHIVSLHEANES